jgi:membrane protease subunit (stomatin/prohibitin family)
MRGRGLALMAGMAVGRHAASQQAAAQQQQQAQAQPMQAAPMAPVAPTTDVTTELQKLADLHKSGVLTDEEFAAAKKKLLG